MELSKATLEMAAIMADGQWHSSSELGNSAGKFIRPEVVARFMKRKRCLDQESAKIGCLGHRLRQWRRLGWVESRTEAGVIYWRALHVGHFKNYAEVVGGNGRKMQTPVQEANDLKREFEQAGQLLEQRLTELENRIIKLEEEARRNHERR